MSNNNSKRNRNNYKKKRNQTGGAVNPFGTKPLIASGRRVKLGYCERLVINEAAAGAGITVALSLNSLFDPNAGGIGLQPLGFDQLSAMYGQFKVWSVRAKCTFTNVSASNQSIAAVMFATYQPAVPANPDAWMCQPFGKNTVIEPLGGRSNAVLECTFDIPQVLGLTKQQYQDDMDFVGTPSGNPTRQAYLMVGQRSLGGATSNCYVYVQLEYTAQFMQPLALNLS